MEIVYHSSIVCVNNRSGKVDGVRRAIASSMPSKNVRMMMRTLTSQASHDRSSNREYMSDPDFRLPVLRFSTALCPALSLRSCEYPVSSCECRVPGSQCSPSHPPAGYWVLGTGYWVLGTRYWVLATNSN